MRDVTHTWPRGYHRVRFQEIDKHGRPQLPIWAPSDRDACTVILTQDDLDWLKDVVLYLEEK